MDVENGFTKDLLGKRVLLVELQPYHGLMLDPLTEALAKTGASVDLFTNHHHKKFQSLPLNTQRVLKWKTMRSRLIWFLSNRFPRIFSRYIQRKKYDVVVWSSLDRQSLRVAKYITSPQLGIVHEWRNEFRTLPEVLDIVARPDCSIFSIGKHIKSPGIDSYFLPYHITGFDPTSRTRSQEMAVIGNYQQSRRDYELLFSTMKTLTEEPDIPKVSILAHSTSGDIQLGIDTVASMGLEDDIHFKYSDQLHSEVEYHETCAQSTFCLPLLDDERYDSYRTTRVSGTLSKIFNCELIPIIDNETAASWSLDESIAIIYEKGELASTIKNIAQIPPAQIEAMQKKIRHTRLIDFEDSVANLTRSILDILSK